MGSWGVLPQGLWAWRVLPGLRCFWKEDPPRNQKVEFVFFAQKVLFAYYVFKIDDVGVLCGTLRNFAELCGEMTQTLYFSRFALRNFAELCGTLRNFAELVPSPS